MILMLKRAVFGWRTQLGNAEADAAADLSRRLMDARRVLLVVRNHWYPFMLHNHDGRGGTAPDPLVWDQGGVSYLELLVLIEQWAGHRLLNEKVTRPHVRADRPFYFSSVLVSEGIEIRHGCQFFSSLIRALAKLPGGIGRFLPCGVGSHKSRLRHLGWNQCSHGLTSRPLESCHHQYLNAVCGVLGYPKGSAAELVLRCCTTMFSSSFPPWSLSRVGNGTGKRLSATPVHLLDGSDVGKRVPLTRKTRPGASSHVNPDPGHPTPRRWKRLLSPSSV